MNGKLGKQVEENFKKWLAKKGYIVRGVQYEGKPNQRTRTGGWPDFMVETPDEEIVLFEVKSGGHEIDEHQQYVLDVLKKHGFRISIAYFEDASQEEPVIREL